VTNYNYKVKPTKPFDDDFVSVKQYLLSRFSLTVGEVESFMNQVIDEAVSIGRRPFLTQDVSDYYRVKHNLRKFPVSNGKLKYFIYYSVDEDNEVVYLLALLPENWTYYNK
jgi:hypothetical protein